MGNAFAIQGFFIPVLKRNKNPEKYVWYTFLAYLIGGMAYYYISYMGAMGIMNRGESNQSNPTI